MHLDTIVTMVDVDTVVIYPNLADQLQAYPVTWNQSQPDDRDSPVELQIGPAGPFLQVAAETMRIDVLQAIDTGLDPVTAEREQWDDGNNTLAIDARLAVAYERNEVTNASLRRHGIDVIEISGSELGSGRAARAAFHAPSLAIA